MQALDGPRFFRMAYRLPVYGGVMAIRQEQAQQATRADGPPTNPGQQVGDQRFLVEHADLFERRKVR